MSRTPKNGRRIVARSVLADSEQSDFATPFQLAAEQWIVSNGAMTKGQQDANRSSVDVVADAQLRNLIDPPRRYDALDSANGVADFWCIANSGKVTVIIAIVEGS